MAENSKQKLTTLVSVVVALIAIVYALVLQLNKPSMPEGNDQAFQVGENNPVVMMIDEKQVTRAEVLDNFSRSGSQLPQGIPIEKLFPMIQEQYLVGELLTQAAEEEGISVADERVLARAKPALEQALRAVYLEVVADEGVSENDLKRAYEDMVVKAPDMMERHARHILIKDEGKANAILIKAQNTSDFAKLAKENSEGPSAENGGDLGYFIETEMVPEFAKAAFAMKVGDVSDKLVKTQFGYHIIKIEDERVREKPVFEDVKDALKQQLSQAVIADKLKQLRDNAKVELLNIEGQPVVSSEVSPAPAQVEGTKADTEEKSAEKKVLAEEESKDDE